MIWRLGEQPHNIVRVYYFLGSQSLQDCYNFGSVSFKGKPALVQKNETLESFKYVYKRRRLEDFRFFL